MLPSNYGSVGGMLTVRIRRFGSIAEVLDCLVAEMPPNPFCRDRSQRGDGGGFEWVDYGDDDWCGRIIPSFGAWFVSPFLYRGQTARFSPCYPAIYRGYPAVDTPAKLPRELRERFVLANVRIAEFRQALGEHPSVRFARNIGLHLNETALAQHYGVPTDFLDLTQDPEVAAFFAACVLDEHGGWRPASNGEGVIYRVDVGFPWHRNSKAPPVELVGVQTLPRPGEQRAWAVQLPFTVDFERLALDAFVFPQSEPSGATVLQRFDFGRALFPHDELASVAARVVNSTKLPRPLLRSVLLDFGRDEEGIEQVVDTYTRRFASLFGIEVDNSAGQKLTDEERLRAESDLAAKQPDFLRRVGSRGVLQVQLQFDDADEGEVPPT